MNTTVDDAMVTAAGTLVSLAGTISSSASAAGLPEPEHMPKHDNAIVVLITGFSIINLVSIYDAAGLHLTKCIMCVHPLARMLVMGTLISLLHLT
jgi:hypothetical protein